VFEQKVNKNSLLCRVGDCWWLQEASDEGKSRGRACNEIKPSPSHPLTLARSTWSVFSGGKWSEQELLVEDSEVVEKALLEAAQREKVRLERLSPDERERERKLIRSDADIHEAAKLWCTDPSAAELRYGNISDWDTSSVTNMKELFVNAEEFNADLSRWRVGNVTNMVCMFEDATAFRSDLSQWDVGSGTDMSYMFESCDSFPVQHKPRGA
jgi:surface protein